MALLGSPTDSLDLSSMTTAVPFVIGVHVWDSLVRLVDNQISYQIATAITPNADATRWTITMDPRATFADGRPITARDALSSLRWLSKGRSYGSFFTDLDLDGSTVVDDHTAELALTRPRGDLVEAVLSQGSFVVPDGTTDFRTAPTSSGPFRVESFSADGGTVLVRNENYWGTPAVLERLEVRSIPDPQARLAALTDGQIDLAIDISGTAAQTLGGASGLQVLDGGVGNSSAMVFYLNARVPPFDDPQVREAVKIAVDRQQLVDVVLPGQGTVGNDVLGMGLPGYDTALTQRQPDLDKARSVLAASGVTELGLTVGEITPGLTAAAELLRQQLSDVGVNLTITSVDPATMFDDTSSLLTPQMLSMYIINRPPIVALPTYTGSVSPYSFSGWSSPEYDAALAASQATVDPTLRNEALATAQQLLWSQGGDLVWGYKRNLSAAVAGLSGVSYCESVPVLSAARLV